VPPQQCPTCGRFLKRALVDGLVEASAPCPKCGNELTAEMFGLDGAAAATTPLTSVRAAAAAPAAGPDGADAGAGAPVPAGATTAAPSVRPPDLPPSDVRDAPDPLAGWDVGAPGGPVEVRDERPFPIDTIAVVGSAAVGAVLGATFGDRPVRDGIFGALGGAVGAAVARQLWQLP
jgi:hypothetical protein